MTPEEIIKAHIKSHAKAYYEAYEDSMLTPRAMQRRRLDYHAYGMKALRAVLKEMRHQ